MFCSQVTKPVYQFRWDKGDLSQFYYHSDDLLSRIKGHIFCANDSIGDACYLDINVYYCEIVHCLVEACKSTIPRITLSALKHYWSPHWIT